MAPQEVLRYTDKRGDTIIVKFDPSLINSSTESALEIFHEWRQVLPTKIQLNSVLLDKENIIERWKKDKKPSAGFKLYEGKDSLGRTVRCRFVPFEKNGKGYIVEVISGV